MSEDPTATGDSEQTARQLGSRSETRKIGNYRLLQKIGEGGMGEVWEAEQLQPVQRRVALKLIKRGMDSAQVIARFESERQALALMDHPAIARVFDAGATERGRPYFVMEHVHGVPITEYCDRHRLTVRQRLEIFLQVCDGIQHAHQKAIIHRDVKPSNILITEQDGGPVPKIIDFGVAKATAQPLTQRTLVTELGQLIGTPEYMSPEQAELTGEDIDIRTDVYSLGMVLYELLVGGLPFDSKELRQAGLAELQRHIRDEEPVKPSTQITRLGDGSTVSAKNRGTNPPALVKSLQGDLDWIVMTALAKDRNRRYLSAHAFALDIDLYLRDQAVSARPPSAAYRATKFVRRHKVGVAAASFIVVALLLGFLVATLGFVRARRAEARATREAMTARQVSDFLVETFQVSNPTEARGNTVTAREILDAGAERVERELQDQPLVQARLMGTMGQVYQQLGLYGKAVILLEKALEIRRGALGDEHLEVSESHNDLGYALWERGEFADARPHLERALEIREQYFGSDSPEVAQNLHRLGNLLLGDEYEQSKEYLQRALQIREAAYGTNHADVSQTLNSLGAVHYSLGEYSVAKTYWLRTLSIREEVLGSDHPHLAMTLSNLGVLLKDMGEFIEARKHVERAIEIQEKVLGPDHPNLASGLNNLAEIQTELGAYSEAEPLYQRAIRIEENADRSNHPELARFHQNLGDMLTQSGDYDGAALHLARALEIREEVLDPDHADTAMSLNSLAALYAARLQYTEAEELLRRSLQIWTVSDLADHPGAAECFQGFGEVYAALGRHEEAEQGFKRALEIRERILAPGHPDIVATLSGYASLLRELQRDREAAELEALASTTPVSSPPKGSSP